ncbi:CpaD family pilus assembly protein [Sphingomonas sanguinis]|uniref:CpaD family pilus assembly protein n=1 Tax=Sphingomonas sanguinis TaxID=33051 RepID=A0ABU5LUK6_9SPHN|nr:CpaD family pilus assembly lipoprotein [Sphingomonas sanguinis]MDZ7283391.1 CpaD family pilus assembly protein [Sphingomonas sanguinis]
MRRFPLLLTPLGLALMTGGCMGAGQPGLESTHQPVVSQTDYALDLALSGGRLATDEDRRLDGWARNLHLGYGDRVAVEDPAGEGPVAYREVANVIGRYALLLGQASPITRSPVAPATIRVVVTRSVATVPGCPDLRSDTAPDLEGRTSSNHGCAINRNLAAMVANPTDLVQGVGAPAATDPATATRAVRVLRVAPPTGNGGTTLRDPNTIQSGGGGLPAPSAGGAQ